MSDKEIMELFKRYKATRDEALRNKIVEHYFYIAQIIAKKFVGRGVEYDDLLQVASLALIKGVERFDPDLGMQFTTFITPTITGEIKNYFRDKARTIKLPRRLSELCLAVRKFAAEYESKHGEKPSVRMIAEGLKLSEEEVIKALEVGGVVSLDASTGGEDGEGETSLYGAIADENDAYDNFETKEAIDSALKDCTEDERLLIQYRYKEGLSQSETAKRLGVSQMFVSRLERKLLGKLKGLLKDSF